MNKRKQTFSQRVAQELRGGRSLFSAIFTSSWNSLGSWLGTYDAADPRNVAMRGVIARPVSAADLAVSTPYIRNLCRNYERNNSTVRAMTEGIVANVVGSGIALEPDTGDPAVDEKIREVWDEYIRDCFVDGMGLYAGQTLAMRDTVVAGEAIWRFVVDATDGDKIPLKILPLEAEWLGDSGQTVVGMNSGYVGGVKIDQLGRPISYSLYSPSGVMEEVPAAMVAHIFERRRALQIRGEPWYAPILTTLRQEKDLVTSELEAAKNTSGFAAAITTNGGLPPDMDEKGDVTRDIRLGSVLELQQGEDIKLLNHTRPSQQIAPFRDMLRGDMAGACRIGRRWIDRDVSQANYTSTRVDMLDQERLTGPVREWFGHATAGKLYEKVLPYLAIKAGVAMPRDNYRLVPDGQPYVDPLKDAQAAAMAIEFGLSTFEQEVGKRGGDYKQIWAKLAEEKKMLDKLGIVLHTPSGVPFGDEAAIAAGADNDGPKTKTKPGGKPGSSAENHGKAADRSVKKEEDVTREEFAIAMREERAATREMIRDLLAASAPKQTGHVIHTDMRAEAIKEVLSLMQPPSIQVNVPQTAAPEVKVNVQPSEVRIEHAPAPTITVNVPESAAPVVNVTAPAVTVENEVIVEQRPMKFTTDSAGNVTARPMES
jgi:lambda family phage portal protein